MSDDLLQLTVGNVPNSFQPRTDDGAFLNMKVATHTRVNSSGVTERLVKAAKLADFGIIRRFIDGGADPNTCSSIGDSILQIIIEKNGYCTTQNSKTRKKISPDEEGAILKIVQFLLLRGANPSCSSRCNGITPLHVASNAGYVNIVRVLLQAGASLMDISNKGLTALHFACIHGYPSIVALLCKHAKNLALSDIINLASISGESALHIASRAPNRSEVMVHSLLVNKAVTTIQNNLGSTPLHIAAENGNTTACRWLLGSDTISTDYNHLNQTAIELANIQDYTGNTALHLACIGGFVGIVKVLLAAGANTNILNTKFVAGFDRKNNQPIHCAATHGRFECLEALIAAGASVTTRNEGWRTPSKLALLGGHKVCYASLCKAERKATRREQWLIARGAIAAAVTVSITASNSAFQAWEIANKETNDAKANYTFATWDEKTRPIISKFNSHDARHIYS